MQNIQNLNNLSGFNKKQIFDPFTQLSLAIRNLSGLIEYAPLNETTGSTATNYAPDTKGTLDGTITGATLAQAGKIGRAIQLDGINDTVTFSGDALDLSGNAMTMFGLFYPTSKGADFSNWFHKNFKWGFKWGNSPSGEIFAYVNTGSEVSIQSDEELSNDAWHFLFLTYDGDLGSNNLKLYDNAVLKGQANATGSLADTSGTSLSINSDTTAMAGKVQHLGILDNALSLTKIQKLTRIAGLL